MFIILGQTHKLIANEVYNNLKEKYNVELNLKKLKWGSIAPDYLPYYKLIRHYKKESINYITLEICNLIFFCRYSNLNENTNSFFKKYISKKLGIILHYLCDYTCYPHANRITCINSMREHLKYEAELNEFAIDGFKFKDLLLDVEFNYDYDRMFDIVKTYIEDVVCAYMRDNQSFDNDLNYALFLSTNISEFVVETVLAYSEELQYQFI